MVTTRARALSHTLSRRKFLAVSSGAAACLLLRPAVLLAEDRDLNALVKAYAGDATPHEGRVKLDIAKLVDNGNSVPVVVSVDSPMTADDHVTGIALFNEKNPQHEVAEFTLGPHNGRARVSTRIRLAMGQKLVAVAKMRDGSCWTHTVEVIVTLAACLDE